MNSDVKNPAKLKRSNFGLNVKNFHCNAYTSKMMGRGQDGKRQNENRIQRVAPTVVISL